MSNTQSKKYNRQCQMSKIWDSTYMKKIMLTSLCELCLNFNFWILCLLNEKITKFVKVRKIYKISQLKIRMKMKNINMSIMIIKQLFNRKSRNNKRKFQGKSRLEEILNNIIHTKAHKEICLFNRLETLVRTKSVTFKNCLWIPKIWNR